MEDTHTPVNSTSPANPEFGTGACYSLKTELPLRAGADPDLQPWSKETACLTPERQSLSIKPSCVPPFPYWPENKKLFHNYLLWFCILWGLLLSASFLQLSCLVSHHFSSTAPRSSPALHLHLLLHHQFFSLWPLSILTFTPLPSPVPRLNALSSLPGAVLLLPCPLPVAAQGTAGGCGCTRARGAWAPQVGRLPGWPLSLGTDRAELYLPFLVISGTSTCHQNFGWKQLPLQMLLLGNKKRSCGWTGIVSLESNLEMQSIHLGCLFILFFTVVLLSRDENTQHSLTKKKNFFFCFAAKNGPVKKSEIHSLKHGHAVSFVVL